MPITRPAALAALAALAVAVPASLAAPAHDSRYHARNPGCRTRACDTRVGRWWWIRHHPKPTSRASSQSVMQTAVASWYDDAEGTACGTHYPEGFASLILPCGTRVEFCAARCSIGTMQDRGPYIGGRTFDLNAGLKEAIGASDLGTVRWRVVG